MLGNISPQALLRIVGFIVGAFCVGSAPARAECVARSAICHSLDGAGVVFTADVEAIRVIQGDRSFRVEVRFQILEAFKGAVAGERTLQFVTTAESFQFQVGQRVLLYASFAEGAWSSDCTRTRIADEADAEIRVLRALARGQAGGLLDGNLVSVEDGRVRTNRYPGLRVTISPKSGKGSTQSAITNAAGQFQFDWVSPGDYILVLAGGSSFADERREVNIRASERCLTLPMFVLRSR
jgi:hypothetical protein